MVRLPARSVGRSVAARGRSLDNPNIPPVTDQLEAHYAARLESFSDGDAVGTLTDQQNTNDLTQSTSSKKPTYRDNATDNIGGHPVVEFDGSDDLLSAGAFYTPTSGEIIIVGRIVTTGGGKFVTSHDEGNTSDDTRMLLGFDGGSTPPVLQIFEQDQGNTVDSVTGDDTDTNDHIWDFRSSGTAYAIRRDGSDQSITVASGSDSGDWFGDINAPDNFVLGGAIRSSDETFHLAVEVAEFLAFSKELTSTERSDVEDYLNNTVGYGVF